MRVIVKPTPPEAKIWDPSHSRFLPPDGMEVELDHHWERMSRQGNVEIAKAPIEAAKPAKPKPDTPAE